jgi:hypothetical protein
VILPARDAGGAGGAGGVVDGDGPGATFGAGELGAAAAGGAALSTRGAAADRSAGLSVLEAVSLAWADFLDPADAHAPGAPVGDDPPASSPARRSGPDAASRALV